MIFLSATAPPPVARFSVTSPVRPGQQVIYRNLSYDPAPGHVIIFSWWVNRVSSYSTPGYYLVELLVEDDRGLWGEASRTIHVLSPAPPSPRPSPPPPAWSVRDPGSSIPRGGSTFIEVTGHPSSPAHLDVPDPFRVTIPLEGRYVDYASLNDQPFGPSVDGEQGVLYVPWDRSEPADGSYRIGVTVGSLTQYVTVDVRGSLTIEEPLRAQQDGP